MRYLYNISDFIDSKKKIILNYFDILRVENETLFFIRNVINCRFPIFTERERERDALFVLFEITVDYYLCSVIIEVFLRGIQSMRESSIREIKEDIINEEDIYYCYLLVK